MRTLYNRFNLRTQQRAGRYRAARNALVTLDPNGSWQSRLQVLKDTDIRGPGKDDDEVGNSRFEPSWIWLVPHIHSAPDTGVSEQVLDDSLQVEWSKSQARKQRWEEEVVIIQEEMRRVITYHEWKAKWWRSQAARRTDANDTRLHGVAAYAQKQAHLSEQLAQRCATLWLPALKERGIFPEWEEHCTVATVVTPVQCVISSVADDHDQCEEYDEDSEGTGDEGRGQAEDSDCDEIDFLELDN
jgi:hypothetical protein